MDIRDHRFLKDFGEEGQERLIQSAKEEKYLDGEYLFHEGNPADGICLVMEGQVEILKTAGSREQTLGFVQAGDFLGEAALLDGQGRSACARSLGPSTIIRIPTEPLLDVLEHQPVALTMNLFQQVLTYFRRTNELFVREVIHKEKLSLVGEMAAALMHDLRNPLTGIRMAADVISLEHEHDERTQHACDAVRLQCDRVAVMAEELLEFSRGEAKLHLKQTSTTLFIEQFTSFNEDYINNTGIEFIIEAEPAEIEIDPMRLLRLLQNLVSNAVEAINGAPNGRIEIRAWAENSVFHLSVTDNGPGIPDPIRDRLYEPFATYGKKSGTGLGMAIVKNVVTAHRGSISFESSAGQGVAFLIQLPQIAPAQPHLHAVSV